MKKNIITIITYLAISFGINAQTPIITTNPKINVSSTTITDAIINRKMTTFNPMINGFKFENTFVSSVDFAGINGLRLGGLCGGMVYSALDYFNKKLSIPSQTFRPANRTTLQSYIYARQSKSLESNIDKWTELIVNPFGWRNDEFFNWGLQGTGGGRLQELKEMIDSGKPVPLGMFKAGSGGIGTSHHQVLAIGYELGRYKGELGEFKEDFKIFLYDPNFSNEIITVKVNATEKCYYYENYPSIKWMTYFVDKKYSISTPPLIRTTTLAPDNLIRELQVEIKTGGDDLRGGNDNCHIRVHYKDGTKDDYLNVNRGARWIDNYCETVLITLRKPATRANITGISLITTFGGGIGGDNWNVDNIYVVARSGSEGALSVCNENGAPLIRFDGNNRPYFAAFR